MSTKLYNISDWCRKGTEIEDYPYIGEVDINVSINEVIKIDENYYAPGVVNPSKNSAGVTKIELDLNPDSKDYTNNLTCPYCGNEDIDSWELSDNEDEHKCGRCRAIISYQRVVTVVYNSSPKTPPETVEARWKAR